MFVRRSLCVILLFAVSPAWSQEPAPPEHAQPTGDVAEIHAFFQQVAEATKDESGTQLLALMDTNRYWNELIKASGQKLSFIGRIMMKRQANAKIAPLLVNRFGVWTSHTVSNVKVDGDHATALVRYWDDDEMTDRQVFSLHRRGGHWKFYDIESLGIGISMLDAAKAATGQLRNDPAAAEMVRAANLVTRTVSNVLDEDLAGAEAQLALLKGMRIPASFRLPRWIMEIAVQTNDYTLANYNLHMAKRAKAFDPECVYVEHMLGLCYSNLERHEDAIRSCENYIAAVGPDADAEYVICISHDDLGETEKAISACLRGLDDTAESLDLLQQLAFLLPETRQHEFGTRLAAVKNPEEAFEILAGSLTQIGSPSVLETVVNAYEKLAPADPDVVYYRAEVKAERGDYREAADLLKPMIATVDEEEERQYYIERYLDDMMMADKAMEAYNSLGEHRSYVFRYMLDSLMSDDEFEKAKELIRRHQSINAKDPAGAYFAGRLLQLQDKLEDAVQKFLEAETMLPDADLSERLQSSLMSCWIAQGKPLEAYRRAADKEQVFMDLVPRLFGANLDARIELINLHENAFGRTYTTMDLLLDAWRQQGKHADVLRVAQQLLTSLRNEGSLHGQPISERHRDRAEQRLFDFVFRSLVDMRRFDEALTLAIDSKDRTGDPYYEVIAYAHLGDVESCEAAVEFCLNDRNYEPDGLLEDEDGLREVLMTKPFERIWTRFFLRRVLSLTAFEKTATSRTTDEFVKTVSKAFDDEPFDVYVDGGLGKSNESYIEVHGESAYTVNYQSHAFFVMWQSDQYEFSKETQQKLRDGRIKAALDRHHAWFSVDLDVWPGTRPTDVSYQLFARLFHALIEKDNTVAIMDTEHAQVARYSEIIDQQLQSEYPRAILQQMRPFPVAYWDDSLPGIVAAFAEARERWPEFVEAVASDSCEECYVLARLTDGEETERIWVDVQSIADEAVKGTLNDSPEWLKGVSEGDEVTVKVTEVDDWMYDKADGESIGGFSLKVSVE